MERYQEVNGVWAGALSYRDIDKKMQIPEIKVAGGVDDKKPYQYCLNVPVKIERPEEKNYKILMRDGEE